ncbi:hypothetical protein RSOL_412400 [Rhizoctonia solani AG-3 Rhs1AP]|uniref:Uncharacterized protein n=1 Tax=Rhizoctonia solani AG-3 Rhs1AP TaxID=1086054 RepID=X8JED7_9AGAM|nr:hypothetical protein RSOL_412400 [Rhizoctonia solani AG-3 Rhs1AP]
MSQSSVLFWKKRVARDRRSNTTRRPKIYHMANDLLHPIVIQAIISGLFECLGEGLLHEGVGREEPNVLKDLVAPTKTSKRIPIEDRERPKKWWKAQCLHYGLQVPSTASIGTYRVHLENAIRQRGGLKRPQDLADLELEQNAKFKRLNAEVREATSGSTQAKPAKLKGKAKTTQPAPVVAVELTPAPAPKAKVKPEPKAKPEPKTKAEPKSKAEPKTKSEKSKAEPKAKSKSKVESSVTETVSGSKAITTKKRKAEVVIHHVYHHDGDKAGQVVTTSVVDQETVKRPTKKARTVAPPVPATVPQRASSPDLPPSYSQVVPGTSLAAPRTKQTARRHRFWRFNGQYEISCTSEDEWPSPRSCRPSISVRFGDANEPEFEGFLELPGFMTCLLRLKSGAPRSDDGHVRFEWCGREEGMGEILTPNSDMVGWLKVHHDHEQVRSYIKGMITGRYGEFTFNGKKVGSDDLPDYEWEDFGERAYEEANRQRWR